MYGILGGYVFSVNPFPVANILTADNNEARNPQHFIVCLEAEHRQHLVLYAVNKMVEAFVS
jgi:hypothetical protein